MNQDIAFKIFSFLTRYDQIKACHRAKTIFSPHFKEWERLTGVYSIFTKEGFNLNLCPEFFDYENIGCIHHIKNMWKVVDDYIKTLPDKRKNDGYFECDYRRGIVTYYFDGHNNINEICEVKILAKNKLIYSGWHTRFHITFYFNPFYSPKKNDRVSKKKN